MERSKEALSGDARHTVSMRGKHHGVGEKDVYFILRFINNDLKLEDVFPCAHRSMKQYILPWDDDHGNPVKVTWASLDEKLVGGAKNK
jgi:hypothetical protein